MITRETSAEWRGSVCTLCDSNEDVVGKEVVVLSSAEDMALWIELIGVESVQLQIVKSVGKWKW